MWGRRLWRPFGGYPRLILNIYSFYWKRSQLIDYSDVETTDTRSLHGRMVNT